MTDVMAAPAPLWLTMLRDAAGRLGSNQAVADRLGVSRTQVSLILSGKYTKSTARIEQAVLARLDVVACPHLAREIGRDDCTRHHQGPVPQSDRDRLKHWVACRKCPVRLALEGSQA